MTFHDRGNHEEHKYEHLLVVTLIKFLVCFGFMTIFLGLAVSGGGESGGSFCSSITMCSADRFLDNFLLLPSPSVLR